MLDWIGQRPSIRSNLTPETVTALAGPSSSGKSKTATWPDPAISMRNNTRGSSFAMVGYLSPRRRGLLD